MSPIELLAPALDEDNPTLVVEDLVENLEANVAQLWATPNAALYTQITDYHRSGARVIEAGPAGGSLPEILQMVPGVEAWAKMAGCTQVHITAGRRGWVRALREQGYEEFAVILRKVI